MNHEWPEPERAQFEPVPPRSLIPKTKSIFTLRPVYNTEQPPRDEPVATTKAPRHRHRRTLIVALLPMVLVGVAAGSRSHQAPKQRDGQTSVIINGAAKPKATPNGSQER